jgi:hypothetical protein
MYDATGFSYTPCGLYRIYIHTRCCYLIHLLYNLPIMKQDWATENLHMIHQSAYNAVTTNVRGYSFIKKPDHSVRHAFNARSEILVRNIPGFATVPYVPPYSTKDQAHYTASLAAALREGSEFARYGHFDRNLKSTSVIKEVLLRYAPYEIISPYLSEWYQYFNDPDYGNNGVELLNYTAETLGSSFAFYTAAVNVCCATLRGSTAYNGYRVAWMSQLPEYHAARTRAAILTGLIYGVESIRPVVETFENPSFVQGAVSRVDFRAGLKADKLSFKPNSGRAFDCETGGLQEMQVGG